MTPLAPLATAQPAPAAARPAAPAPRLPADWAARVRALEQVFREVQAQRMQGLPLLHPGLQVQALGFLPEAGAPGQGPRACGVLITPWFMNLLWLPLQPVAAGQGGWLAVGQQAPRRVGAHQLQATGAHEPALGAFEACSLMSPLQELADQAAAVALGFEILKQLRAEPMAPALSAASDGPADAPARLASAAGQPAGASAAGLSARSTPLPAASSPASGAGLVSATASATASASASASASAPAPARRSFLLGRRSEAAR